MVITCMVIICNEIHATQCTVYSCLVSLECQTVHSVGQLGIVLVHWSPQLIGKSRTGQGEFSERAQDSQDTARTQPQYRGGGDRVVTSVSSPVLSQELLVNNSLWSQWGTQGRLVKQVEPGDWPSG